MNLTYIGGFIANIDPLFDFLSALIWPLLILIILLIFRNNINNLLISAKSRRFIIKAAGFELEMEKSIQQLKDINEDFLNNILGGNKKPENLNSLLWIDDTPENNAMLMQSFNDNKIKITTALSTADALSKFEKDKFDAIISDWRREKDGDNNAGINLTREIRKKDENIPIFIWSRSRDAKDRMNEAKEAGVTKIATSKSDLVQSLWNI